MRFVRFLPLSLLLMFGIALSAPAQDPPSPVVEGTLVGHDGTVPTKAHVSVYPPSGGDTPLRSTPLGDDKTFRIELDTTGVVSLWFTGTNHQMQKKTMFVQPADTIGIDVQLGTYSYRDSLSNLQVIGDFNDFSFRSGTIPTQKRDDGTYAATIPSPEDSVAYQLLEAHDGGRSINGTQSDTFIYDGGGDYRSVVAAPNDSTRIVFDPEATIRSDTEPSIQYRDTASTAAQYAAFVDDVKARREAFFDAIQAAEDRTERKAISDTFDWSPNRTRLTQALQTERPTRVQNAYRAAYLANTQRPDSTVVKEALATIPPSSPLWGMAGGRLLSNSIYQTGGLEAYEDLAYEALRKNPDDDVKAGVVMTLLRDAAQNDEKEKQKMLYAWLEAEYGDTPMARIARSRYATDRTIQAGNSVPSFEVAALRDTTKTFTLSAFEGQYVLLDFWATWCGPCIDELPTLRKADSTYGGDDFTILSLSFDGERSTVTDFLKDREMPWKHAFVEGGFESDVANKFEVVGIPKPILIGPNGRIVATEEDLRGEKLLETLEEHLGPTADASSPTGSN